jgi:hypothetical protein
MSALMVKVGQREQSYHPLWFQSMPENCLAIKALKG